MSDDPSTAPPNDDANDAGRESTEPTDQPTTEPMTTTPSDPTRIDVDRLRELLDRAVLAGFVLVAIVAAYGFYAQAGAAIETWVSPAFQPIVLAVFNLSLLVVAVAGASYQLDRLRDTEAPGTTE